MSVFRAQYLLEIFGHRGNIYVLQHYQPDTFAYLGGNVIGIERVIDMQNNDFSEAE